ncbi:MAG: GntR family transcriptional regulator [Candidatus Limnocylindrales bacterium]
MTSDLMLRVETASPVPLYHQIMLALERQIESNQLKEGDRLPSERDLAKRLGVSRMTIRQAVRALVLAGYCYRARGRGVFVRRRRVFFNYQSFDGFTASMRRAGRAVRTISLGSSITDPPEWVREGLELDDNERTVELVRLRVVDEEPAILETEWFSERRFPGLLHEDMSQSLYSILEGKYATRIASTSDLLGAHIPTDLEAGLLAVAGDQPVIVRMRIASLADGTPVEAVHSVYNGDQFEFRMSLVRESPR